MRSLLEWSALRTIYRSFGIGLAVFFLIDCWIVTRYFDAMGGSDDLAEYANALAIGTGALLTLVISQQHPARSWARLFWYAVSFGLLVMASQEAFDIGERMDRAWADDDYIDLVVLGLTPIGLYLACMIEAAPRLAVNAMRLGFIFQCFSALIDLGDGDLYDITLFGSNLMNVLTDISELIFIETYLFGLSCLLLHILMRGLATAREARR
ncbi:hypothetical protein [Dongia sp.]|uniref:hypothetical protein n=1 Tax=Dongia sp. TaxID=1977262 RepID=UPI0035B20E2C